MALQVVQGKSWNPHHPHESLWGCLCPCNKYKLRVVKNISIFNNNNNIKITEFCIASLLSIYIYTHFLALQVDEQPLQSVGEGQRSISALAWHQRTELNACFVFAYFADPYLLLLGEFYINMCFDPFSSMRQYVAPIVSLL